MTLPNLILTQDGMRTVVSLAVNKTPIFPIKSFDTAIEADFYRSALTSALRDTSRCNVPPVFSLHENSDISWVNQLVLDMKNGNITGTAAGQQIFDGVVYVTIVLRYKKNEGKGHEREEGTE